MDRGLEIVAAGDEVNFSSGWKTLWSGLTDAGNMTNVMKILTAVGVILLLLSLGGWIWGKRKGGSLGQGTGGVLIVLIIGCALSAPNLLIPAILGVVDGIGNGIAGLFTSFKK